MKTVNFLLIGIAMLAITTISCNNNKSEVSKVKLEVTPEGSTILADSLIYGIETHENENSDISENEAFKSFLQEKLINYLFDQIYSGNLKAYDFFSDKELSTKEVREIEKAEWFSRSKVGKIQFDEQWYIDKDKSLRKRVKSMTLGVESYSNQGNFIGYRALFKVKF